MNLRWTVDCLYCQILYNLVSLKEGVARSYREVLLWRGNMEQTARGLGNTCRSLYE